MFMFLNKRHHILKDWKNISAFNKNLISSWFMSTKAKPHMLIIRCMERISASAKHFNRGIFGIFSSMYCIQHCFICRPSDSANHCISQPCHSRKKPYKNWPTYWLLTGAVVWKFLLAIGASQPPFSSNSPSLKRTGFRTGSTCKIIQRIRT